MMAHLDAKGIEYTKRQLDDQELFQLFLIDPKTEEAKLLNHFDYLFCLIFFIDYLRQIFKAKKKVRYIFGWGLFDLASSIPAIGPLRFLRLIRILRVLRAVRSIRILTQVFKSDLVGATIVSSMTMSMGGIILACFGVLHYESTAIGANNQSAHSILKGEYKDDLSVEDALKLCVKVLGKTMGVPLFQEQAMQIAIVAADGREALVAMNIQQFGQVELGLLEHLHLADVHILQGVDAVAGLLDLVSPQPARDERVASLHAHSECV